MLRLGLKQDAVCFAALKADKELVVPDAEQSHDLEDPAGVAPACQTGVQLAADHVPRISVSLAP